MENIYSRRYWLEERVRELGLPFDMMGVLTVRHRCLS